MRLLIGVVMMLGCGGNDGPCKTPTTWCEAGSVMRCEGGEAVLDADCAMLGDRIGVMKACGRLMADTDHTCVDQAQASCATLDAHECAPNRTSVRTCVETDFGMIWDSDVLATCTEGQRCHPTTGGQFVYVTPPATTCTGAIRCDGLTLETCAGNPVDGYVLQERRACPTRCSTTLLPPICE